MRDLRGVFGHVQTHCAKPMLPSSSGCRDETTSACGIRCRNLPCWLRWYLRLRHVSRRQRPAASGAAVATTTAAVITPLVTVDISLADQARRIKVALTPVPTAGMADTNDTNPCH